nr:hypothetical protein [Tanacetum cinerariifolium]
MFNEYFNGATLVLLKSSVVSTTDASDKRQQPNTTPSTSTIVAADTTQLGIQTTHEPTTQAPHVTATENIYQAENVMVDEDEFINIFSTPVHEVGESSSRHVDLILKAFEGNGRDLGSFGEETDKIMNQYQDSSRFKVSEPGDSVTIYTRRRHTSSSDSVTTSLDGVSAHRLNSDLEDSTL